MENVDHFGSGPGLVRFVDVGDHGNLMGLFDFGEDFTPLFKSGTPKGMNGRAIGLIEGSLENERNSQFGGDFLVG